MTNVNDIVKVITKLHHQFEDDELLKSCYKIILTKHSSWTATMRKVDTFFELGELGKEILIFGIHLLTMCLFVLKNYKMNYPIPSIVMTNSERKREDGPDTC